MTNGDVMCYNRGCGKMFDMSKNSPDSTACQYHPGSPFFHETYKGWTCCKKKSTDFTDFLNTPGCETGPHSREKPVEPESITGIKDERSLEDQMAEHATASKEATPEPMKASAPRPDWSAAPLTAVQPKPSPSFQKTIESQDGASVGASPNASAASIADDSQIKEGEPCKNGGCKAAYSQILDEEDCVHHPGVPIFHEGMKFWSCCQRKTSDFTAFLNQAGCATGQHKWKKDSAGSANVKCRFDWHQTATHVTVAVYAKKYDHKTVKLDVSPVRLKFHVYFPQEAGSFDLDLELKGVIEVGECSCTLTGTKIEIKMKKAEPGSWARLEIPRPVSKPTAKPAENKVEEKIDALDLDDLDFSVAKPTLSSEASGGRTDAEII